MILIIGGEGAGKKAFAASLGFDCRKMPDCGNDEELVLFADWISCAQAPENTERSVQAAGRKAEEDMIAAEEYKSEGDAVPGKEYKSAEGVIHAERLGSADPAETERTADLLSRYPVVIANEVGSGIIPVTKEERLARELSGRMTVLLAKRADTVVRVVCGIPAVIKGSLPDRSAL